VVDLSHQTIITCLKQLHFLKQKVGVEERVEGSWHVCNGGQSTALCRVFMDAYRKIRTCKYNVM